MLSTTPHEDEASQLPKSKKRKQNKSKKVELIQGKWFGVKYLSFVHFTINVYFVLVNGATSSNKKAAVKNLTSKRLSDFLDDSNKSIEEETNHGVSSAATDNKNLFDKYSIINLKTLLGTDEFAEEAPVLFVGRASAVDPTQNLHDIIESYNIFKEISSIEDQFR